MKRMISLLIALALIFALPMSAMAVESPGGDPPGKTGDTAQIGLWIAIMVVSLLLLIVVAVAFRKSMKKKN